MKALYRGYRISVRREKTLGGGDSIFYFAEREPDGFMPIGAAADGSRTLRDVMEHVKAEIDAQLVEDDPFGEKAWREDG